MKILAAVSLLAIIGATHAQDAYIFKSVYAPQDVALDTNPQSAFWRGADPVFAEVDIHGKPVPRYRTEVRSRWTKDSLYLLYICPYEELYLKPGPNPTKKTMGLWNWDVAELFIGWDFQDIKRYKEFEVSPQGEWIDLDIDLNSPHQEGGWKWNSGFEKTARVDHKEKVWYAAMRIPFAAIAPHAPAAGTVFRANLFRCQGRPERRILIAWKAPMADTFHTPERFGRLELVDHP